MSRNRPGTDARSPAGSQPSPEAEEPITEPLEPPTEPQAVPEAETETIVELPEPVYNTALYQDLGINVCPVCGDKKRTDAAGQSICAATREDCPNADSHPG